MTNRQPKVLVFDLDYTLWPFWIDTHVSPPFRKGKNSEVVDAQGQIIRYYKEVPEMLLELSNKGYQLAVASRTSEVKGAKQLLQLLEWDKYFKYKEIYPGNKTNHLSRIQEASGIPYNEMIFFDDEQRNINDASKIGVCSVLVKDGMTRTVLEYGFKLFRK